MGSFPTLPTEDAFALIVADRMVDDTAVMSASYPFTRTNSCAGLVKSISAVMLPDHTFLLRMVTVVKSVNENLMMMETLMGATSQE